MKLNVDSNWLRYIDVEIVELAHRCDLENHS